jgi:porin
MPSPNITVTTSIINTVDSSTTSGFDDFGDGLSWTGEADFKYKLGDLPGGQNVGFLYSFDQEFTRLGGRLIFQPGEGLSLGTEEDTWAVYWSGWQYLYVENPGTAPINLANGEQDLEGLGLFARFGFADQDTNPVEWSFSGGIGGRGIIPSRDNDTFGVGYFYSSIQTGRLSGLANVGDRAQGFETFYNCALTPAAHLTLDVQVVESPAQSIDDAVVLGARLGLRF